MESRLPAQELAGTIVEHTGDPWLRDFLRSERSLSWTAIPYLVEAMRENQAGEPDLALASARKAIRLFNTEKNLPGSLRAQFEEVYALHRASRGKDCLDAAFRLRSRLKLTSYRWLRIQTSLEMSLCEALMEDMGNSLTLIKSTIEEARAWGFPTLVSRGLGLLTELNATNGNDAEAWRIARQGVQIFLSAKLPPMRAYQLYAGIAYSAENHHEWSLAVALNREANFFVEKTANLTIQAMAHYRLAGDALMVTDNALAADEFSKANRLFAGLPPTVTWKAYQSYGELILAGLSAQRNQTSDSLELLSHSENNLQNVQDYVLQLTYLQIKGDLNLRRSQAAEAERSYLAALQIGKKWLQLLHSDDDRLAWNMQMGNIYRALVRLYARSEGDPAKAWEIWETYRAVAAKSAWHNQSVATVPLTELSKSLSKKTLITYVVFDDGVGIWVSDDRGLHFHWQSVTALELERQISHFRELCSKPKLQIDELTKSGQQLYSVLLAPVEAELEAGRVLIIDADASLTELAFSALVDPANHYLVERFALVVSPSLTFEKSAETPARQPLLAGRAIIVAPLAQSDPDYDLLPLKEAVLEAHDVAMHFKTSNLLLGADATLDRFEQEIAATDAMHFAGHAVLSGGRIGLVFSKNASTTNSRVPALFTAEDAEKEKLGRLRLVVLSACSTAGGETNPFTRGNLVGGFLRAGVPHVIGTHWDVDSATTRTLVEKFYFNLESESSVAIALRTAQLSIFSDTRTAHPYYWAAMAAFGGS